MKGIEMYSQIKDLQKKGFSVRKTADYLGISRETAKKYRKMTLDAYMDLAGSIRKLSRLDAYKERILSWLHEYPDMSSAQVYDWLLEHYALDISERSVSRYVKQLREDYVIPKVKRPREYEAMVELPMGQQMQLDFGVKNMPLSDRQGHKKVYFVCVVLAHSRYKWGSFQNRPFTAVDLTQALDECFAFFGGIAQEIVVDQDSIITVSENYGDIIYTYAFEQYKQQHKLNMRVCRKADPESKGMVENTVKYIKQNFLPHRYYMEPDHLNAAFLAWLERTGNAKVHGTTKKVPAKVFEVEREHLRPILFTENNSCDNSITRSVRKDNTVLYNSNRYSVPLGTYTKEKEVEIRIADDKLQIWQVFGDYMMAEHPISLEKGRLIKSTDHTRNKDVSIDQLQEQLLNQIGQAYRPYLLEIRKRKTRYYRDQLLLLKDLLKMHGNAHVEDALCYCSELELYSIPDLRDTCKYLKEQRCKPLREPELIPRVEPISRPELIHVTTQKRNISEYMDMGGGFHE